MNFFRELFQAMSTGESLAILGWLLGAGLIGFLTAWWYWRGQADEVNDALVLAEREASELRIRNTELLMSQEDVRKEINGLRVEMGQVDAENKKLKAEKGQLYADKTYAEQQLEKLKKSSPTPVKDKAEPKKVEGEISLENVMKASATLTGLQGTDAAPIIEDAQSSLEQKISDAHPQNAAISTIKSALGHQIKKATAADKDNLQMIKGVGPFIEGKLNNLGIFTFEQISQFDEKLIDQLTEAIQFFPGRILRDDWVGQAKSLMK